MGGLEGIVEWVCRKRYKVESLSKIVKAFSIKTKFIGRCKLS